MKIHPTPPTLQVTACGAAVIALGVVARLPGLIAFGGAMLLAVLGGRVLALATVTRLRRAGFEMVWLTPERSTPAICLTECVIEAELRNRGSDDARGFGLRAIASPQLDVEVSPARIDLPAGSRAKLTLKVRPTRAGHFAIHAIALEVRGTPIGSEGLFEVPLMFANSHGIAAAPAAAGHVPKPASAARTTAVASAVRGRAKRKDGDELRELRHYASGDPFKRISWKASARRGKLIVRDLEEQKETTALIVLEAAPELYAGVRGHSPLDGLVEAATRSARKHLQRGDRVGVTVYRARHHESVAPEAARAQGDKITLALMTASSFYGEDQSSCQGQELAHRVIEHARQLDSRGLRDVRRSDLIALSERAEHLRQRAPFRLAVPNAETPSDARLRHYLRSYGVDLPPREQPRELYEQRLADVLLEVTRAGKVDLVCVFARVPLSDSPILAAMSVLRKQRIRVIWTPPHERLIVPSVGTDRYANVVHEAVASRAALATARGSALLAKAGAQVTSPRRTE
jgi:uncharacterized protein (DUF58 family)